MKDLNIIVKADVQGSAEAVKASLEKLSNEEVRVRVIHCAVGAISESDVMLASTSGAIIVGFNVRPDNNAKETAARVQGGYADVPGHLRRHQRDGGGHEGYAGPQVPRRWTWARPRCAMCSASPEWAWWPAAMSLDGKMQRGAQMRLLRDNIVIYDGAIASLQRFKDSVKEVAAGLRVRHHLREVPGYQGGRYCRGLPDGADRGLTFLCL